MSDKSMTVRLQADGADPDDRTQDIARRTHAAAFVEAGAPFILPDFVTPSDGVQVIVEDTADG